MAAADEFELVTHTLERTVATLRQEAERTERAKGESALARHIKLLCDAVSIIHADIRQDFASSTDPAVHEAAVSTAQEVLQQLRAQQPIVSWLRSAKTSPLDLGTRYYVDRVARQVVSPEAEVTVVAVDAEEGGYAALSDPYREIITACVTGGVPTTEPAVVVVFIPRREEHSGLLHPLLVHELGHAADAEHNLIDQIVADARGDASFEATLQAAASALAASNLNLTAQAAGDLLAERLRAWCAEFFCDTLATLVLGPTYLYAFVAEVLADNLDTPGESHPPPRARVRSILDILDGQGWAPSIATADQALDTWLRSYIGAIGCYSAPDTYLLDASTNLAGEIRSAADARSERAFIPGGDLDEVVELLNAGIPPAQLASGAAAPREAIILAGWWAAIKQSGGGPAGLAKAIRRPELAQILPAALELAALTEAWTSA